MSAIILQISVWNLQRWLDDGRCQVQEVIERVYENLALLGTRGTSQMQEIEASADFCEKVLPASPFVIAYLSAHSFAAVSCPN